MRKHQDKEVFQNKLISSWMHCGKLNQCFVLGDPKPCAELAIEDRNYCKYNSFLLLNQKRVLK